jgi:hypothetical protein
MISLGTLINSVDMTVAVPSDKLTEIKQLLSHWSSKSSASKRQIQSILGVLQFAARCVRPGRLFVSRMLNTLRQFPTRRRVTQLSLDFKKDLSWWFQFLETYNGVSIIPDMNWTEPDAIVATDACLSGCGALSGKLYFRSTFPEDVISQQLHINALELLTILVACKLWGKLWKGLRIRVYCDNIASVIVLNSGKARDPYLLDCLREISFLAAVNQFEIKGVHIAGSENRIPDILSRWHLDPHYYANKFSEFECTNNASRVEVTQDLFCMLHRW